MSLNGKNMALTGASTITCSMVTVAALCQLWAQACIALPWLLIPSKMRHLPLLFTSSGPGAGSDLLGSIDAGLLHQIW